jgi:hypothetical protein
MRLDEYQIANALIDTRLVMTSLSAVSEAPTSEELGVETLWKGASDTAT